MGAACQFFAVWMEMRFGPHTSDPASGVFVCLAVDHPIRINTIATRRSPERAVTIILIDGKDHTAKRSKVGGRESTYGAGRESSRPAGEKKGVFFQNKPDTRQQGLARNISTLQNRLSIRRSKFNPHDRTDKKHIRIYGREGRTFIKADLISIVCSKVLPVHGRNCSQREIRSNPSPLSRSPPTSLSRFVCLCRSSFSLDLSSLVISHPQTERETKLQSLRRSRHASSPLHQSSSLSGLSADLSHLLSPNLSFAKPISIAETEHEKSEKETEEDDSSGSPSGLQNGEIQNPRPSSALSHPLPLIVCDALLVALFVFVNGSSSRLKTDVGVREEISSRGEECR
ncbi:hypothetical protein ACLOJK_017958 [Asimina triloba]